MNDAAHWLALILVVASVAMAVAALMSRALFVVAMYLAACGALCAAAFMLLGAAQGALAMALVFALFAPLVLLAVVLLSSRVAKAQRRPRPWLSGVAALALALGIFWVMPELGAPVPRAPAPLPDAVGGWLAPLVFVVAAACAALLGYGERGALHREPRS
ncbi:MAG: hypothetical protein J0L81_07865 [Caulobacterales bacterium]|jgi:hypothetical protein|nr:hypothetical protein [Caulobacterales bacterium]